FGRIYGCRGGEPGVQMGRPEPAILPQWLADRFGWDTMVATIARAYDRLPPADRGKACIFTGNYGEAGAVDFFGPAYGLPHAISGHNTYFLWGPDGCDGQIVMTLGISWSDLEPAYGSVEQVDTITCDACMPYGDNLPVYVRRQPKVSLPDLWPRVRHFD